MAHNFKAINAKRAKLIRAQEAQRINEIARVANQLQEQQRDLSRTEALRVAEIMVARAARSQRPGSGQASAITRPPPRRLR